ncbi:hypothetical protein [Tardiphaga sp.]|uniref:hypothetical protein n=1 Tax=Tardiphaga sp. TaxID=1926292 RepID=UPI002624A639|nr:hypothetical protein [Tardiphaga sp.]MDB5620652.1 hypothetical protein [Tardiphaga sp.]
MRSIPASRHPRQTGIHPALQSFADECGALAVRLLAYAGVLGLIAIGTVRVFDGLDLDFAAVPSARKDWAIVDRVQPAFAVSQFDSSGKTASYEVRRHPDGGRKDVLGWAAAGERRVAELELYRPGGEAAHAGPPADEIAGRMDPEGSLREIAGEGIVDSKFGPVALLGFADRQGDGQRCLGFLKNLDSANLRISGWSCQGDSLPARRAAIACTLNRLVLLAARNDAPLAELFARAELKRGACAAGSALPAMSADWVTGAQNPLLRGSL